MDIYSVKIKEINEFEFKSMITMINKNKQYSINKLFKREDKMRALISEILLRVMFFKYLGLKDIGFSISKNEYGKPYLKEYKDFNFNISHSADYVICAVDDKPIGADIEKIIDIDCKSIAENFFAKTDVKFILESNANEQLDRFYEIWTLKESYIKAEGKGLSIPLNSFDFHKDNQGNITVIKGKKIYILKKFDVFKGYKVAVCSLKNKISDNIIEVDQEKLIDEYKRCFNQGGKIR